MLSRTGSLNAHQHRRHRSHKVSTSRRCFAFVSISLNSYTCADQRLTDDAIDIFKMSLKAANPVERVKDAVKVTKNDKGQVTFHVGAKGSERAFDMSCYDRVVVVGAGKAAFSMAQAVKSRGVCNRTQVMDTTK